MSNLEVQVKIVYCIRKTKSGDLWTKNAGIAAIFPQVLQVTAVYCEREACSYYLFEDRLDVE